MIGNSDMRGLGEDKVSNSVNSGMVQSVFDLRIQIRQHAEDVRPAWMGAWLNITIRESA